MSNVKTSLLRPIQGVTFRDDEGRYYVQSDVEGAAANALALERSGRFPGGRAGHTDPAGPQQQGRIDIQQSGGIIRTIDEIPAPFPLLPAPSGPLKGKAYEEAHAAPRHQRFAAPAAMGAACPTGYDPALSPEAYLGAGCGNADYVCDKGRMLPPWLSDSAGAVAAVVNDFTSVGTVGAMRAAFETLYSFGNFTATRFAATVVGAVATATVTDRSPAVGVRIDWGVSLTDWAPFDLELATVGFVDALVDTAEGDRSFTVRVGRANGGSIYVPFANRVTGMSMAQPLICRAPEVGATVTASNLPAGIAPAFNMQVQLICAYHPITAAFGRGLGLYEGDGR